ncbi:unnamed protein product [Cochlearia groenlandica]
MNQPFLTPSPNAATSISTPQTSPNFAGQSVNDEEGDAREKEDDGEVGVVADGEGDGEDDGDENGGGLVPKTLF